MSKVLVIDLEMNQPSDTIIEIGYIVGNKDGRVFEKGSVYHDTTEEISKYITDLTGIDNTLLKEKGLPTGQITQAMNDVINRHSPAGKVVVWGQGDVHLLLSQFPEININRRYLDMKTIYQMEKLSTNSSMKSGLFKAAKDLGIDIGSNVAHRGSDDAYITYLVFCHYVNKFKKIAKTESIWGNT